MAILSQSLPFPAHELTELWQYLSNQAVQINQIRKAFALSLANENEPDVNAEIFGKLSSSFQGWIQNIPSILLENNLKTFYEKMLQCSESLERLIHQLSEACIDKRVLTELLYLKQAPDPQAFMDLQSFWQNLEHFLRKWLYAVAQYKTAKDPNTYSFLLKQQPLGDAQQYHNAKLMMSKKNMVQKPNCENTKDH